MRRRRRGEETVTSRKSVAFMVAIVLAVATLAVSAGAQGAVRVFVDGDQVLFDQPPITQGGRVLVPLRGIFEKMGAVVEWNAATRAVRAARGTTLVELQIGSRIARVDGRAVTLDVPPMVVGGRTLVPLRFISESLGAAVDYRAESRTVLISTTGQAGPPASPPPQPPSGQTIKGVIHCDASAEPQRPAENLCGIRQHRPPDHHHPRHGHHARRGDDEYRRLGRRGGAASG